MNPITTINPSLMDAIRSARRTLRATVYGVSLLFINALVAPDVFAIQDGIRKDELRSRIVLTGSPEQKLNQALLKLQESSREKHQAIANRLEAESGLLDSVLSFLRLSRLQLEKIDQIQTLEKLIAEQHDEVRESFDQTEQRLLAAGLPQEVLQRHRDTVAHYERQYRDMMAQLERALSARTLHKQGEAFESLNGFMQGQKLKRTHQSVDPDNLPWGTPGAEKTRKPAETAQELSRLTGFPNYPQGPLLASNVITPEMLGKPGGPTAEDLAATIDVTLSDEIRTKALELNDDPVEIYNWVRNNIEFIPSYGSIQGAHYTLQSGRGNAFDTASLLIALLRAANIPARYAYGTVQMPAEQVMNWVGGVDVPSAAQQLLGQGGIPNLGMVSGGKVTQIKMEHVWVEAWVDYFPSRGAKHRVGDTWVPLDASFKQYEFTPGQDLATEAPFDVEGLIDQVSQNATIDEQQGFVQDIDSAGIEAALEDYQTQIEDYINNQNPDATVGDVLGIQKIIVQGRQELAAGLPYTLIARTHNYSQLPNNLRHKFRYTLGTEYYGYEDVRLITFERSLPELAGKKLALSFRPDTEADEQIIASYIPEPDPETGEIDPAQLPSTLPGHLIRLAAELRVDGEVAHSSSGVGNMGGELHETLALWSPGFGWAQATNAIVAGEYQAIGLGLQGANAQELVALQANLEQMQGVLEDANPDQLDTLSGHAFVGDLLSATIISYLAMNAIQDQMQAKAAGVVTYQQPSFGKFSTNLQTSYFFGIPRNVNMSGLVMDVDRLAISLTAKDNRKKTRLDFMQAIGARASALEHLVPEQIFSTKDSPAQGISAVKALAIASAGGQRIWTIDQSNVSTALNALSLGGDIKTEIRNAVRSGKVATAHETSVAYAGGRFAGYIILDPETGAGAYKIGQGENGGFLEGLGYMAAVLGLSIAYKELLARLATATSVADVLARVGSFLFAISFALNVSSIALNCNHQAAAVMFTALYTVITILSLALLLFAGPIGVMLGLTAIGIGSGMLKDWIISTPLCRD